MVPYLREKLERDLTMYAKSATTIQTLIGRLVPEGSLIISKSNAIVILFENLPT